MTIKSAARQPVTIFWAIAQLIIIFGKKFFENEGIDSNVLLGGNSILFAATLLSLWVSQRSMQSPNPNAAVRSLYGSFMIKFFLIIIAAFIYIMMVKKNVNKPALFICMGLYVVYTVLEVSSLQKMMKQKKEAEKNA